MPSPSITLDRCWFLFDRKRAACLLTAGEAQRGAHMGGPEGKVPSVVDQDVQASHRGFHATILADLQSNISVKTIHTAFRMEQYQDDGEI